LELKGSYEGHRDAVVCGTARFFEMRASPAKPAWPPAGFSPTAKHKSAETVLLPDRGKILELLAGRRSMPMVLASNLFSSLEALHALSFPARSAAVSLRVLLCLLIGLIKAG